MVDQRSWVHVLSALSIGCVWEIDEWVLPAVLLRLKGWGVGLSVLRLYAAHCIKLVCMLVVPEGSLFYNNYSKIMLKKTRKQFDEDKQTGTGLLQPCAVVWWDQDTIIWFRCCQACVVRSTKTSMSCLQSSMVVGVSWSGVARVLPALGSYSSLREPWMPTCTVTYWSRAWSPPFGDWAAGHYSNMITTPNTPPRWPLPC